jgi:hypothetical protein
VLVGDTAREPLENFPPPQLPEALQKNALIEDQVTIEILPGVMLVGLADNTTVGVSPAGAAGEARTKGESAIIEAIALATRTLRSEETSLLMVDSPRCHC